MRVNHVGEICAQALYTAQAAVTRDPALRAHFERGRARGDRPPRLDARSGWTNWAHGLRCSIRSGTPARSALGLVAGRLGDRVSLGFVVETERQVEAHLDGHLDRLPAADHASRAIVAQMKDDEAAPRRAGAGSAGARRTARAGQGADARGGQGDDDHRALHLSA